MTSVRRARVEVSGSVVGDLSSPERPEPSVFVYREGVPEQSAVSVTMPVSEASYAFDGVHPIFAQNLPEGYLGDIIRKHVAKLYGSGDLTVLATLGRHQVGRVVVTADDFAGMGDEHQGESLGGLLAAKDDSLFEELVEKYALRSGVSGVQPKVLVPASISEKSTLRTEGYIVKTWGDDYPHLAANEYFCMTVAREFGLPVPDFYLSDNGRLFIMSRFDRRPDGSWLGFEDACVLQGLLPEDKYSGSYEKLAKTLSLFLSPQHRREGLRWLFRSVLLSWAVRNGDAHLKNFGLLYCEPFGERWLAPTYDIVSTTPYLKRDVPALTLAGRKVWWPLSYLKNFARQSCGLTTAEVSTDLELLAQKLTEIADQIDSYTTKTPAFTQVGTAMSQTFRASSHEITFGVRPQDI